MSRRATTSRPRTAAASADAGKAPAASSAPPTTAELVIPAFLKTSRRYPVDNITPARLREIRRMADQGETQYFAELLDDVSADEEVFTLLNNMKLAAAGAPIAVDLPEGDDSDAAAEVKAGVHVFLKRIPGFRQLLLDLLDGEYQGFASLQPAWSADSDGWWVHGWQSFESRLFRFPGDGETPILSTERAPSGEPLPEGVLFYRCRQRPGPVMRGGIGWAISRPWLYKGYCLVDGMSFLERFGHPHVQVQIPPSAVEGSQELAQAKNAAKSLIVDQVALVPPGVTLTVLDKINAAATVKDVYLAFIAWCDAAMSKAFLGQSITTDDQGATGSLAKARVGFQVKTELTAQRAGRLCEFINRHLVWPWITYHFGPKAPRATFRLCVEPPTDEKAAAEVAKAQAETAEILSRRVGLPLSRAQLYARSGFTPPKDAEDAIGGLTTPQPPKGAALSGGMGSCPGCGAEISLAAAEKKKRLQDWAA